MLLSKTNFARIFIALSVIALPVSASYAAMGCCSHHGGVAGCNTSTNHQKCKDGSSSPSCLCTGGTAAPSHHTTTAKTPANTTTYPTPSSTATTATTPAEPKVTKPKKTTAATTAAAATTTATTQRGCCSGHGGVKSCNKKTHFQVCKDGSTSTTCKC